MNQMNISSTISQYQRELKLSKIRTNVKLVEQHEEKQPSLSLSIHRWSGLLS